MKRIVFNSLLVLLLICFVMGTVGPFGYCAPVTLKLWMAHTSSPEMDSVMKELVRQYNKENPQVVVNYESLPGNQAHAKLLSGIRNKQLADVIEGWSHWPVQLAAMGQVLQLDDQIAKWRKDGTLKDFVEEGAYNKWYWQNHYWGIPWGAAVRCIFYRKDLLQQAGIAPPKTWDEFQKAVIATHNPPEVYGLTFSGGNTIWAQQVMWMLMFQSGGSILNENGELVFNSEENMRAMTFLTDFCTKYKVTAPGVASYNQDDSDLVFAQGKAAFAFSHGGMIATLLSQNPALVDKVGVLPVLQGPKARRGLQFYNPVFITKNTKSPTESLKLCKWLISEKVQIELANARLGYLWPTRKSILANKLFTKNHLMQGIAKDVIPFSVDGAYPYTSTPQWSSIDGEYVLSTKINEVLTGRKTVAQAMDEAYEYMVNLYLK